MEENDKDKDLDERYNNWIKKRAYESMLENIWNVLGNISKIIGIGILVVIALFSTVFFILLGSCFIQYR